MALKDLQQNIANQKNNTSSGNKTASNTTKNTSKKKVDPYKNSTSSYKKYSGQLTQDRYNELRNKGYTKEEIENAYMKGNPQMTQELYNHLRDQGYSKKEIEKGHYDREFLIPWRTQKTAGSSFGNWGRDVDAFTSWSDKNSGDISKYDLESGTSWESTFRKNANKARDYMTKLQQAGISPDTDEFNAYKQYYDYFSGMARNLSQNNKSFTDYRSNFMYDAGDGNYYTYDQAKKMEKQLRKEAETARNTPKKFINTGLGGFIDPESIQSEKEAKDKDAQADAYAKWLAKQDKQKAQSDWLTRNLGRGQDSEKVYQSYADRMAAADAKKSELESKRPDYYSYGISDELGNVYAYNDEAYNKDVNAWSTEYNNYMRNVYYPTQKQFNYASDVRDMTVIKNANVDSPQVRAVINRGKAISNGMTTADEEAENQALNIGNYGGSEAAQVYHLFKTGASQRKHINTDTWSEEKKNTYYFLLGSGQEDSAERFAKLTNDAIEAAKIAQEVYKPIDEYQAAHPGWGGAAATAAGIALPLVAGVPEYLAAVDEYLITGEINPNKVRPTGISERMVSNTAGQLNEWSGTINNNAPVIGGKGVGDLYQVALSAAQSYLSIAASGGMEAITLTQFFGSAASSKIYESLDKGMDPGKALALGTLSGIAEVAGEKLSIDNLIKIGDAKTARALLKDILIQAGIEGSEEAFTNILNTLSDYIVNGDKNALQIAADSYASQGMSLEEANKQAMKDWLNEIGYDAVSGALSGAMGATGQSVRANVGRYQGNVGYLNDLASQTAEGSRSRQMAEEYGTRDKLSAYRGNQYAAQVQEDLVSQNTDTAVRAIEQRLTELGETGNVHQKAQDIANAVVGAMTDEEAGGWSMRPSDQISANATKNMRQVVNELMKASNEFVDYSKPDSSWTDPIMKGRFLDQRILSGNKAYNALYNAERKAENTLKEHTTQVTDLSEQILEAKKELGRLSPTDSTRRTELNNKIREAEKELKSHQDAILSDGRNVFTEEQKAASVDIDGKEYKVSGLTMADGQTQAKLTDADGNTMNVSIEDERLPAEFRNLALKVNTLGWAASMAFEHYKTGTDIRNYIYRVQAIQAFASEKISREAFMNSSAVKALNDSVLAEFLYSHGQELYNERQAAVEKAKTIKNKIVQAAMEKTGDIDNVRTKGKGRVDTTSGWTFSDGKHYEGIQGKKLTKTQNSIVRMINNLADVLNIDYVIFDGDAKGVLGVSQEGGVIAININAGMNVKRALAAETLSHELTHFQENFAPEEYEALRDAVINAAYEKNAALFEKRVQAQMRLLPESIKGDQERYDAAVREVVADACTTMLQNSKVVTELARENMTLAEKVHDFIEQTINSIKQAIAEAYADSDPAYRRQEVSLIEDKLNEIQQLWDEGLKAAVFNYNALQTMRDATEIGSFSIQQFKEAKDSNGDDVFQVAAFEHDEPEYRAMLKTSGMSDTDIDDLFTTIDSAMEIIKSNLEALDYAWEADIDDRGFLPVKPNSDKLYKVSQDFSTLCRKRILQGAIANQLQAALNRALTREEGIAIRDALMAIQAEGKQIEVACALCYVEAARMKSPAQIQKFLNDKEKVLRDYFSGQDRATMKHKIEQAELDVRRQIREELGDITAKDGTQINILDPKDSPLKKLPTKIAQRIRDAKRAARSSYTVTEEQQKIIDEAMKMTAYDFTDPVGLENLAKKHREIFDAYTSFVRNATKSKGIENDTWWRAGDSNSISDLLIRQMNDENGLRTQSWSDFQVKHLMDYIAATIELSSRGAKQHAYTKVIDYVDLMGDTGVMINMSLIPTREYNGKLEYDNVEGFVAKEARRLREKYHKTAGTICIGIDNDQIRQLLADDFIDYVIPYHNSGMAAHTRAAMHIPTWENYQDFQGEKKLSRSAAEENAKRFGVKLLDESDPMYHESPNFSDWYSLDRARQHAKNAGKTGKYGVMTGGYAAMQDAARNYMQICAERGLAPKFSYGRADFSGEENYWKLLIDRKMVDNVTGDIIEQEKIQPRFDFNTIERILNDELDRYGKVKADQNEATRRVTEAFLSGKLKAGMSAEAIAEIMQKPVDNISITNITQNAEGTTDQYQMADDAKERFGTTTDFAEAGYVLRDGSMLRFTNDKHAGTRDYDHRAIGLIYGANIDLTKNHGFNAEAGKYLEQFVEDGNIRFEAGEPDLNMDAGIQLSSSIPLTREQEQTIRDFIEWKEQREASYKPDEYSLYNGPLALHIDFGGDADIASFAKPSTASGLSYYGNINPDRVIQDIRNYYLTGEVRQPSVVSQFHSQYQMASDQEYMDAVNSGNTEEQQRMVDEAARAAGYTIRAYHGSPHTDISIFDINRAGENTGVYGDRAIWFTDSERFADDMSYQQLEGSSAFRSRRGSKGKVYDTYLRINNPFDIQNMTPAMRDLLWEMNLSKLRSMGMSPENSSMGNREYFFETVDAALEAGNDQYVKFYVDYSMLQEAGYDAIIARLFTNNKRDNSVEYGVFSPEQIKSADPVTYDQTGNVVPLSQRFNPDRQEIQFQMYDNTADDSMFEAEERQKAWNDLQAENAVLEDTVTQLRKEIEKLSKQAAQLKRTDKPEVRMNDARKMARQIIKDTRPEPITTRDKMEIRELTNRLSQQIKEIGDYILETGKNPNEIDYSEIRSMAQDIARDIVNNAEVEIDDGAGTKDMRDEMRAALRNRPIFVPEQYRSDVLDWNDFKKRYRNIFTFKDSGTDIDIVYQSLLEEIPGLLDPNINNPGDMLNELADKWDVLQPKYENPFDDFTNEAINHYTNMILQGALDGTLRQIAPTYADRMNSRIEQIRNEGKEKVKAARAEGAAALEALRTEKNARIEEIRQQGIARKQEALAKERADKWERVEATREYYQEMAKRATIRRKNSETRSKIKGLINDINTRLLHGTEKKYVPAHLVENTVRILEMIDLDTGRENVKLQERLALLQQQYAALKNDQTFASYAYDPILENLITDMARTVGDTPLRNMNNTQLEKVYQTLRELEHTIRTAVKDKLYGEETNFYESARAATKDMNAISGSSANALGKASNWYLINTMRPDIVFERFGGFAKDSEWTKIADMLNRAQRYGMDLQLKFSQPFEELLKDKKKLAKLTSTKAEDMVDIGLKDENGESIKITRDFMLFVYMNLFNEDNIQHVMRGGITVPALKEYLAGKGDRGYGIGSRHAVGISQRLSDINHAIEDSTDANEKAALLQEKEDVLKEGMEYINNLRENIEKNLTEYDQKWIDAWWKFNKMATDVLNETTMNTYGIKKFLVERYFPIITDRNYLNVPMETIIKDMSLENAGFTKERIHASNPIKMMGLADLINMQANRTAQYASIMPAVRAFNKIYNKTMPGYSTSVKSALNSKFGSEATKFIENLMADLQGGRHSDFTIFDRLRGRMAQATLSLNPRVALAQTASFPTAAAELGWKPVMKALARGGKKNQFISAADRELIQKWSSALWYRSRGYNSVELAEVKNMQQAQHKVMDKLGWAMNWINFMDSATVGRLWYAAQYYVDEKNPELQKGSDAYYEKVAEAFNRTIENTQPNYTTMQRPELLRNPNALVRQLSMFMTQRLQNQSILYGAVAKYMKYRADLASGKNGVTQADVNEMGKRAAWAASSQIAAAATITVFKFLCDALLHRLNAYRRDEDKKLTPESVSLAMLNNFAESLASNMFLGSEIYAATKSAITKETYYGIELSGVTTLTDNINNAVKFVQQPSWGLAKKLGESLAQFYGIPAANAEKIGQAIWYWMEDTMKGEFMEAGVERTDAMNAKLLTEAYASGDKKAIEKYSGTFEDDDDLLDSVRSYIKTGYVSKDKQTISKTEAVKLLVKAGMRQKDAEAKVQEWTCELVTGIPFSKIKDEFMAGNITQSRMIELLQKYGGRDKETAERTARSYACEKETGHPYTDLKEAYILGEVSKNVLEKAVKKYGGMNAEDTQKKLYYYDYLKENPTSDISENRAAAYMTKLKPAGIKAKDYEDILNKADTDKNGSYSQAEVGSWLTEKGYSKKQAEALWSAMGPTWKTGFDAWQVKYNADMQATGKGSKNGNVSQRELGPYLVQQINSGKMSLEDAEGYWKIFFSKSTTTFKKWLKKNRYKLG